MSKGNKDIEQVPISSFLFLLGIAQRYTGRHLFILPFL